MPLLPTSRTAPLWLRILWSMGALGCAVAAVYSLFDDQTSLMTAMLLICSLLLVGLYIFHNHENNMERRWLENTMAALETGSARLAQATTTDGVIEAGAQVMHTLQVAPHFALLAYRQGSPIFLGVHGGFSPWQGKKLTPAGKAETSLLTEDWVIEQTLNKLPESEKTFQQVVHIYGRASQPLGLLILTRSERPFTESERSVTQAFSRLLGAQLGHLIALQELQAANDLTLLSLGAALEQRDNETSGHTLRVVNLSVRLAERLNWPAERIQALRWGAYLHDLGKIAIPDAILHKTSYLTETERQEMQSHPKLGHDILQDLHFLPAETLDVVRYHHERWDGTGYPAQLKETDIPEAARIFALIDVYDALIHARPYKRAWSHQEALEEIKRQSGKHFDPEYTKVFCEMMYNDAELMITA